MSVNDAADDRIVTFYRFLPSARLPQRADRSGAGTLPTRAFRYCEAVCTASALGWYMFAPLNFTLMWDGSEVVWTYEGSESWYPLKAAQFPGFNDYFNEVAPDDVRSFAPPFLGALAEPGIVQIWTGLFARTAPGWSLLLRPLPNLPRSQHYELYEGVIETDRWFGPLFTNIRLTSSNVPIQFHTDFPFLQAQPIPRSAYSEETLRSASAVSGMEHFTSDDWDRFRKTVVKPNTDPNRETGAYAVAARKRRSDTLCQR